ncbi:Short-chain dehydrogenase/reductase [Melia azedarach]|uniref:Short-chain dehydrogenase/reductase n=1 Tax=Melia azedarach TaxID=155640 RepID=A0ACC1X1S4_MELAZ|nr:Short-chain dehydrogenase/reductase [Melia azedarach]
MVFKCMSLNLKSNMPLSSNFRLQGKVAIITGGTSGIGATAAKLFHENGAKVVIADVQDKRGQALADKLGEGVCYVHCDVSNEDDIINLVDTAVAKYGKLDIMYNNAGNLDCPSGNILDTQKSDVERLLAVNTVGGFLGAKHAARVMLPQRKGCILFTASDCRELAGVGSSAYAVSRYGVLGLVKGLEAELGQYGIRVNCVSTMRQMGNRRGQVLKTQDSIANAALHLASDETSYVSGQNLVSMEGSVF